MQYGFLGKTRPLELQADRTNRLQIDHPRPSGIRIASADEVHLMIRHHWRTVDIVERTVDHTIEEDMLDVGWVVDRLTPLCYSFWRVVALPLIVQDCGMIQSPVERWHCLEQKQAVLKTCAGFAAV